MLKNYIKIALRNLWKHKGYSFINIAGLAVGVACALFILLWVQDEFSANSCHVNARRIYRVEQDQHGDAGAFHVNVTPYPMGPSLKAEIPEVEQAVRWTSPGTLLVRYGDKAFFESGARAVDPEVFRVFTFPLVRGEAEKALARPGSVVLTEELARKYFGTENPLGQIITIDNAYPFTVTAVMKTAPLNSMVRPDMLVPFDFLRTLGRYRDSWGSNSILTWVMLHEKSSLPEVNAKITRLHREKTLARLRGDPETWKRIQSDPEQLKRYQNYVGPDFMVRPLRGLNLYGYFGFDRSDQGIRYVYTFSAIALFVLLIACINFMNLATARSANRAREVGLRKVVGAPRKSIAGQFYGESILTTFLAALAALTMVVGLMPVFNSLSGKSLTPAALLNVRFLVGLLAVMLLTGVISGSYPALFLSSFHPIRVLKGNVAGGARSALFRKSLVVVQFGLSVLLLIGMGVVARQVDYMRTKKLGYDKDHLVYLPLRGETRQEYAAFKDELLRDPRILNVTASQHPPTSIGSNSWGADWDGRNPEQRVLISQSCVDFDYTETMKIDLVAGRPFSRSFSTDAGRAFLVNEEVPKAMGLDAASAVGKRFNFMGVDGQIIGVMKNYHYQSVRSSIEPLAVIVAPERFGYAIVRLRGREIPAALAAVKSAWKDIYPRYPVEYRFVDEDFEEMYRSDERMGSILRVFAVMAVFIACLGLFGLASFTAEQRTKEIGVRKVLGASAPGLVFLLSREFAQWVLMANLLAWPAAYFIMKKWLQGFAYKAGIAWWLFALAGAGALFLALCTVSFQAVRAALSNPVDALKYE